MNDTYLAASQDRLSAGCIDVLDEVTEALKVEFARSEERWVSETAARTSRDDSAAIQRAKAALDALDASEWDEHSRASDCIARAIRALDAVETITGIFGTSTTLERQRKFWSEVLAYAQASRAKIAALLARSLRAVLSVPLFLDGPELSGYKHRLR